VLYSPTDVVFYAPFVEEAAKRISGAETGTITGPNGHLNGVLAIGQAADKISTFLAR
jgi:homoserine O-acetyltransferase